MRRTITVVEGAAGERLDLFLASALDLTRSHIQRLIRGGLVFVNKKTERSGYLLSVGDGIIIDQPDRETHALKPPELPVVYEDDDVMVVNKPAGLSVHYGAGPVREPTVADFARLHSSDPDPDRPGIVHRLDKDTSGLLVLAKSIKVKEALQAQFAQRLVHKTYLALVCGRVEPADAIIRLPLDRDPARPLRRAVVSGGRDAVTNYRTLANFDGYTLLEVKPETGRTHQIRVHFATVGHAVAGDITYGPRDRPLGLHRQFLHASALELVLPSGKSLRLESPLPEDLSDVIESLGGSGII
ncbi:MAG TPA: RluA family pseudouridine synthase [Candidatus Saccharimonadia bacterium]|nr:RluA family pseudouridine synthase [Candidatus Saccharimonadia bacterium]